MNSKTESLYAVFSHHSYDDGDTEVLEWTSYDLEYVQEYVNDANRENAGSYSWDSVEVRTRR